MNNLRASVPVFLMRTEAAAWLPGRIEPKGGVKAEISAATPGSPSRSPQPKENPSQVASINRARSVLPNKECVRRGARRPGGGLKSCRRFKLLRGSGLVEVPEHRRVSRLILAGYEPMVQVRHSLSGCRQRKSP
jgi:hypothetical protein